jgi:hypothetical protein
MAHRSGTRRVYGPELTVGARVLVRRHAEADVIGEVVEDYGPLIPAAVVPTMGSARSPSRSPR